MHTKPKTKLWPKFPISYLLTTDRRRCMIHGEQESAEANHRLQYHQAEEVLQVMLPISTKQKTQKEINEINNLKK